MAVLSSWIFACKYLGIGVERLIFKKPPGPETSNAWQWSYYGVTFVLVYASSFVRSIEKLKGVSIVGIGFIVYLVIVFTALMPRYFRYFYFEQKAITLRWFTFDPHCLKTLGICLYIFLNQYTILPICNSVKDVSYRRTSKIIFRTICTLLGMYCVIIVCGYLSQPDNT